MHKRGFALIEVLIALTILSVALLSVYTGVSTSASAMLGIKNKSIAIIIAKSKMNEFFIDEMPELGIDHEPIPEYEGFTYSKETGPWEDGLELMEAMGAGGAMGLADIKKTTITVEWFENNKEKTYYLDYIYSKK